MVDLRTSWVLRAEPLLEIAEQQVLGNHSPTSLCLYSPSQSIELGMKPQSRDTQRHWFIIQMVVRKNCSDTHSNTLE
jgi:hypothetical protein